MNRLFEMSVKADKCKAIKCKESDEFRKRYEDIKKKLISIKDEELCLEGSLNYEYDDWYNSAADEFIYEDPQGVTNIIVDACNFLHECVDSGEYRSGYEIAQILVDLHIMVGGEYQEYTDEPLTIDELEYHDLCELDYKKLVIEAIYVAYCANELSARADAVYKMIENSRRKDITMEMVMQCGEELPELDDFLKVWIEYLGNMHSANAGRLIKEALELTNDQEQLLENARKYYIQHPGLYEQYIVSNMQKEDVRLLKIGKEALDAIDSKYIVRSRIALLISNVALAQGMQCEAEKCWLEAFRSDTTVVNYMRLFIECADFAKVENEVKNICNKMELRVKKNRYTCVPDGELKENQIDETMVYMLMFFGGEFQYLKEHVMNVDGSVGWSFTFMKCGLAAFLLLLLDDDSLQQGCKEMNQKIVSEIGFDKEEYQKGTRNKIDDDSQEWFWKCFCSWKNTISISKEDKKMYLQWIEELVERRVKGIMDGNHRSYYDECAGYIAALGEVKESEGEMGGKQKLLLQYRAMYSRRSAFHRELRAYGMKDTRKK